MSNIANFPPVVAVDRPSQYQKGFYPFSAFSADDPNKTAVPKLTFASPWILQGQTAIVDTAANMASNNPVLLKGQIGFETDTIAFKIGDGSTAYNSLNYIFKGLIVTGEYSAGNIHWVKDANRSATAIVSTSTNTGGTWSSAVTMTGVPSGAKAAYCNLYATIASGAPLLCVEAATGFTLSDITSGNNFNKYAFVRALNSASAADAMTWVPLDANGQFKWCTFTTNTTIVIASPVAYLI